MAAKYTPNPINYNIIPKQYLNTPIMSSEDAFMELEKLEAQELNNEINQVQAERGQRQNEAEKQLAKEYEQALAEQLAAGEEGLVSGDVAGKMAQRYQAYSGQGSQLADDELRRVQLEQQKEEYDRRNKEIKLRTGRGGAIWYQDPETDEYVEVRAGKESSDKPDKPKLYVNLETGDMKSSDEVDSATLRGMGYKSKDEVDLINKVADYQFNQSITNRGGTGKNPSGGKTGGSNQIVKEEVNKQGTKKRITYSDGSTKTEDL